MTDLLEELRAANPVDGERLDLPPLRPAARRRRRLLLVPAGAVLAAAIVAVVAFVGGGSGPDLADRAYAATSAPGIVHWRTDVTVTVNGKPNAAQRSEGWASGGVTHVLDHVVEDGRSKLLTDRRIAGGRQRMWIASDDDYMEMAAPKPTPAAPTAGEDPLLAFRRAYRDGRLQAEGPGRYRVRLTPRQARQMTIVYELDERTARPRRLVMTMTSPAAVGRPAQRWVSVFRFSVYETLPATAEHRALLELLPHPGAGPSDEPVAQSFAVLRQGAPVTGADRKQLEGFTQHMERFAIDVDGIRALGPDTWLLPGHGYVCVAVASGNGIGGGCTTIAKAKQRGIGVGTGFEIGRPRSGHRTIAVPDGVRAVRARRDGKWTTYPVVDGVVTVPGISGETQLVR